MNSNNDEEWRYPNIADECKTEIRQVIAVEPKYDWEIHSRLQKLKLYIIKRYPRMLKMLILLKLSKYVIFGMNFNHTYIIVQAN